MFKPTNAILAAGFVALVSAGAVAAAPPPPPPTVHAVPQGKLTIDSPISALLANPKTRPVMDRHFPKIGEGPHYFLLKDQSIRDLAPHSNGKLDAAALAKINAELLAAQG